MRHLSFVCLFTVAVGCAPAASGRDPLDDVVYALGHPTPIQEPHVHRFFP